MFENNENLLGKNLQKIRKEKKLSQQALADKAGLSLATVRNTEHGRTKPGAQVLEALAKALGCCVYDFYCVGDDYERRASQVLWDIKELLDNFCA